MQFLLSVDLGIKTGFAMFNSDGRLMWYHSQNFGNKVRLRKAIPQILIQDETISYLVMEGGGPLRKLWDAQLERKNIEVIHIMAENWRKELLLDREQRKGKLAKEKAMMYALKVVEQLSDKKTGTLNINAAESILIGLWCMQKLGWIKNAASVFR